MKIFFKILKIILISIFSLLLLLVAFIYFFVNNENLDYNTKNQTVTHSVIKDKMKGKHFVLFVLSTGCPGVNSEIAHIKSDIEMCKRNNIDYSVIFDELHKNSMDREIDNFIENKDFNESFYLIDPKQYKENIKVLGSKRRLKDFLSNLITDIDTIPLGYPQYFYFDNGNFKGYTFYNLEEGLKNYFDLD